MMFKEHTEQQQAQGIAAYMPNGKLWTAKNIRDSNVRKLLMGLGLELTRVEQKQNELATEMDIHQTVALISEWEKLLGIPDASIPVADTIAERRNNVLFKLSVFGTSLAENFVRIAAILGFNIIVIPHDGGVDIPYVDYRKRFVIVVTLVGYSTQWPWAWPLLWGNLNIDVVKAIFEKIKPSVCEIVYREDI